MTNHNTSSARTAGFTLIEGLIAVLMISVTFGAFVDVMVRSYKAALLAQQNFIAVNLAEEGVELIRNKRDNHVLSNPDTWQFGLLGIFQPDARNPNTFTYGNTFDVAQPNRYICRDTSTGTNQDKFINCLGASGERVPGNFVRTVTVTPVSLLAIRVDSRVTWSNNLNPGITLSTILYKTY